MEKEIKSGIHFSPENGTVEMKLVKPLIIKWEPKEDITTWELAMCVPYLSNQYPIMPHQIDTNQPFTRHFKIQDPNE